MRCRETVDYPLHYTRTLWYCATGHDSVMWCPARVQPVLRTRRYRVGICVPLHHRSVAYIEGLFQHSVV